MTLKSAFEDVIGTTLAAVTTTIGKLDYVSKLRSRGGEAYAHWGLARVHGEAPTQKALAESHRLLFLKLLRTPLRDLRQDMEIASGELEVTPEQYAETLVGQENELLPADLGGGSARHLSSVLQALSSLTKHRRHASHRA
jgi:hypothetical protein